MWPHQAVTHPGISFPCQPETAFCVPWSWRCLSRVFLKDFSHVATPGRDPYQFPMSTQKCILRSVVVAVGPSDRARTPPPPHSYRQMAGWLVLLWDSMS